ncbi:hypothetical protein X751_08225 [Mesorhizobium sp. LNJC395A00]|nr:hypothetical protein X751_08225 [Mesorhizobium sp. LNJC395A00]
MARCDANTRLQLLAVGRLDGLDCGEGLEASPNGTLCVILVSHRPPEIGKHAVSEIFGNIGLELWGREGRARSRTLIMQ